MNGWSWIDRIVARCDCELFRMASPHASCALHRSMNTLATNLAIGAFGCKAFGLGRNRGYQECPCGEYMTDEDWERIGREHWSPGCGKQAP